MAQSEYLLPIPADATGLVIAARPDGSRVQMPIGCSGGFPKNLIGGNLKRFGYKALYYVNLRSK